MKDKRIGNPVYARRPDVEDGSTYAERLEQLASSDHKYKDVLMDSVRQHKKQVRMSGSVRG